MKYILIILALLLIPNISFGEEFPPSGQGIAITKETNPIYWGYLEDYGALLKKEFEKSHMFRLRGMGVCYDYFITRDGQIKDMRLTLPLYKYFNNNIKNIILSVPPPPFRDGMELDEMLMSVYLGYGKYDAIDVSIGGYFSRRLKVFDITIITSK